MTKCRHAALFLALAAAFASLPEHADEGMWTFDNPPLRTLEASYGFVPTAEWLEHLRLSCPHIGGSSSFVSPGGLVLTNHHVAYRGIAAVSTPQDDYIAYGFFASGRGEEIPLPNMSGWITVSITDVTARVRAAAGSAADAAGAERARRAEIARIEEEGDEQADIRREVVTLYGGAVYHLYRNRIFTDFRLVFAPEVQVANYGGDSDNFTYPRHDLDFAFLRVYLDGKPYRPEHFLRWSADGAGDGEAVFVPGYPYSTNRTDTMARVEMERDLTYPERIADCRRKLARLRAYSAGGEEEARTARGWIFRYENRLKALSGEYAGLTDDGLMGERRRREEALREAVAGDARLSKLYGDAWNSAEEAVRRARANFPATHFKTAVPGGRLPEIALEILRIATEKPKPNEERHAEYREGDIASKERRISAPVPYSKGIEDVLLALDLQTLTEKLGVRDPFVRALLEGKSPEDRSRELVGGTRLDDADFRRSLLEGGHETLSNCGDPLIRLALTLDPLIREVEAWREAEVEAVLMHAATRISQARFEVYGWTAYPDATATLRLSFGKIAGYTFATSKVPPFTTYFGLYDRAASFGYAGEFALPQRYVEGRGRVELATPLNFACTADIIGGNSGSPVVNVRGEVVGLAFDGNVPSLPNRFIYDEEQARCVAVDSRGILEALRAFYGAEALLEEILGPPIER